MSNNEIQINASDFLKNFPNYKIQYFQDSTIAGSLPAKHSEVFSQEEAEAMQAQFHGVYYSVNGFKHKRTKEDLVSFNGYYVDLDIKKEADIISPEKYQELKTEALNKLIGAPLQPHCIVETKNGYQAVWLISDQLDKSTYIQIEKELISYFGADKAGTSVTKILRLPGFYHLKNPNEPFLCKLVMNNFDQEKFTSDLIVEKFGFSLAEEKAEPQLASSSSSFTVPIKTVIEKTAGMVGIKIDFRKNPDGSEQIIENGEVTSGFISSLGEFVESASGKERRGNHLGIAKYYLNIVGNNNYSVLELVSIIKNLKNGNLPIDTKEEDIANSIVDFNELLKLKLDPVNFLIEDLLPEKGINMIQGHPDSHKSWLAFYFIYCLTTGTLVFGSKSVVQVNVLLINVDDYISEILKRLKLLGLKNDDIAKLHIWTKNNFDILKSGRAIKEFILKNKIKLVVFDTFLDIHTADENNSQEINKVIKILKNIASHSSVLLIHHINKDGGNTLLSSRGSGAIAGSLITSLGLQYYEKDDIVQIKQLKNKLQKRIMPFSVRFVDEGGQSKFTVVESKKAIPLEEVSDAIEEEINKTGNQFFKKELIEKVKSKTKYSGTSIERAFDLLEKNMVIERDPAKHQFNKIGYRLVSLNSSSSPPQPP